MLIESRLAEALIYTSHILIPTVYGHLCKFLYSTDRNSSNGRAI